MEKGFPEITGKLFSFLVQNKNASPTISFPCLHHSIGVIQRDKENEKRRRNKAKQQTQTKKQNLQLCKWAEWISLVGRDQSLRGLVFFLVA